MIVMNGITLPFTVCDNEILSEAAMKMKRAGIKTEQLHFRLYKKSFDARKKNDIKSVSSVIIGGEGIESLDAEAVRRLGAAEYSEPVLEIRRGTDKRLSARPIIVGTGPAGMFCGLLLAANGYAPILIERGGDIKSRIASVEDFYNTRKLNTESNIQFGAGGAGTFSDGKLISRISDARCAYVLRRLVEYGAPESVLTMAKPHIGTDILRLVVANILEDIRRLGGEVIYNCRLETLRERDGGVEIDTSAGEMLCGALVLAIGHSARDTYKMLMSKGFVIEPKPFSVGVRIEHAQSDIDNALYGEYAGDPRLGRGEYAMSDTNGRGVYTFCMCPGGEVVAAATEEGGVVVNGMSYHARAGANANAALAVSVGAGDYSGGAEGAIEFQRGIEQAAFAAGGGEYRAPIQTVGDFLGGSTAVEPSRIMPSYMSGHVKMTDIGRLFPEFITTELKRGIKLFGRRLAGFDAHDAVLTGVETRTSAPVRILRGENLNALGHDLIYPSGEGAGYAGGITSAAVDGIKIAQAIMAEYAPID